MRNLPMTKLVEIKNVRNTEGDKLVRVKNGYSYPVLGDNLMWVYDTDVEGVVDDDPVFTVPATYTPDFQYEVVKFDYVHAKDEKKLNSVLTKGSREFKLYTLGDKVEIYLANGKTELLVTTKDNLISAMAWLATV